MMMVTINHLQLMSEPEKSIRLFPDLGATILISFLITFVSKQKLRKEHLGDDDGDDLGESEDKDDSHGAVEEHPGDPGHRLEKPVADVWHNAWVKGDW